jgi:nondiscriminating aspartyl-tRNA synthetase
MQFEHLSHERTPTSEDSAKARGTSLDQGIKSIILRGKKSKKNYQFNIPSHRKLDMKGVADAVAEKCEFEDPTIILERFGLHVGGVPPFGPLLGLDTYYDQEIESKDTVAFNCGLPTESLVMKGKDLIELVDPKWGSFSKE